MKTLYLYRNQAEYAAELCGKEFYRSQCDDNTQGLEETAEFTNRVGQWSGEVECYRTDDGDIFAWWEELTVEAVQRELDDMLKDSDNADLWAARLDGNDDTLALDKEDYYDEGGVNAYGDIDINGHTVSWTCIYNRNTGLWDCGSSIGANEGPEFWGTLKQADGWVSDLIHDARGIL